mmetsp:Transcript_32819/g.82756  ORF Transcript_32819/g.82756 Transcript_32819/m.82756 type:complete len:211 (-) Transcript_32819:4-636(-)
MHGVTRGLLEVLGLAGNAISLEEALPPLGGGGIILQCVGTRIAEQGNQAREDATKKQHRITFRVEGKGEDRTTDKAGAIHSWDRDGDTTNGDSPCQQGHCVGIQYSAHDARNCPKHVDINECFKEQFRGRFRGNHAQSETNQATDSHLCCDEVHGGCRICQPAALHGSAPRPPAKEATEKRSHGTPEAREHQHRRFVAGCRQCATWAKTA